MVKAKTTKEVDEGDGEGAALFGVVVLNRRGAQTIVNVYGPTTSKKVADAARDHYSKSGTPAQIVELRKLPKLRSLRGGENGDTG